MNYSIFFLLLFLMIAFPNVKAQKTGMNRLEWRIAGSLPSAIDKPALGIAGPVVGVHNNVLLVAGGANFPDGMPWTGGKKVYHNEAYVFQRMDDCLVHIKTVKLPSALAYPASCTSPQGIVVIGGENEYGICDSVFLLQWNTAAQDIKVEVLPSLPLALINASAVYFNNQIFVAGGEGGAGVSNGFYRLNLMNTKEGWKGLPEVPKRLSHAVMVVQQSGENECLYLIGGRKRNTNDTSTLYQSVLQFDWASNRWTEKAPLPYPLSAGTGVAYGSQYILLFGGDTGETFHKAEALIAAINQTSDEVRKAALYKKKIAVQSTHPGFCRQVFLYDTRKDKWRKLSCIPFDAPVTTNAIKWQETFFIPSGEIKAGVRSPYILSLKIGMK